MNKALKLFSLSLVFTLASCQPSFSNLSAKRDGYRITDIQVNYLTNDNPAVTSPYNGDMSLSAPNPVVLKWKARGAKKYRVNIYKDEELTDLVVSYVTSSKSFKFYNDEFDVQYYWNVSDIDNKATSETGTFIYHPTISQPRNMFVDGVENFRDIGGWGVYNAETGKYVRKIKQGMIYRSGRFNADKASPVEVTVSDSGIYELKNHLKIKTEVDLRRSSTNEIGSLTSSVIGDDVNYVNYPMYFGGTNILTYNSSPSGDSYTYDNPAMIKKFFELLAEPNNYPIVYHCSIGKDRTGCLSYLIEGLLGFNQELMYRDYMFTNFANAGMCKLQDDIKNRYGGTLEAYTGDNINQKVYNYLKEVIGVSETDLQSVITILSESD